MSGHILTGRSSIVVAILLLSASLVGCSSSPEAVTPTTLGPYAPGEQAAVGDITLELVGPVVRKGVDAVSMNEVASISSTSATLAGEGKQYVDVRIRVEDTVNGSVTELKLPPLGDPYMIADGERIDVGDTAVESYSVEAPANRLVAEFAVPLEAQDMVVYLPLGDDGATIVSFQVR